MQLVFIDETSDSKFRDYLGFCVLLMNARFYPRIKQKAQDILKSIGWDPSIEFKGSYLFSASSGCKDVDIELRIAAAEALLDLNVAESNRRMAFHFGQMKAQNHTDAYLQGLPSLMLKILPKASKGVGKNLLVVHCDERSDISPDDLHFALSYVAEKRGYVILERAKMAKSTFDTVGLMLADLVGYLQGRIDTIANDAELFEGITPEQFRTNGKIRKLAASVELIAKIKKLREYEYSWKQH